MMSISMARSILLLLLIVTGSSCLAEDGYRLWLRYDPLQDAVKRKEYTSFIKYLVIETTSPTLEIAEKELRLALGGLLEVNLPSSKVIGESGAIVLGTPETSSVIKSLKLDEKLKIAGDEGFVIVSTSIKGTKCIVISGNKDVGVLYGVFHFIRMLQTRNSIENLSLQQAPQVKHRILNHWDNLDRTVERGYAGFSLW